MSIRHDRDLRFRKSRNKEVSRPKTFKTEAAANAYAKANKIENYILKNLKSSEAKTKKLKIIAK